MTEETPTPSPSSGVSRRTLVKGAAWSVPVVAAAVATPLAAASIAPPAAFWATGATVSVVSGNATNYTLEGSDSEGELAVLPAGSSVTITPDPGVTLAFVSSIGIVVTSNPDGTLTAVIAAADVTNVRIRSFTETIPVVLT